MLALPDGPLSLYLHVPLCSSRCSYCGFYSEPQCVWRGGEDAYTARLLAEIEASGVASRCLHTLYVGGGDPANLGVGRLQSILLSAQRGGRAEEVTVEVNPEHFDRSFFPLFETGLVSRLSMGIQTMDPTILSLLGRSVTVEANIAALKLANEAHMRYGIDVSVDLMAALPTQRIEDSYADLDGVLSLCNVEHLSVYCLTIEEGTALWRDVKSGKVGVYDEDEQERFLRALWRRTAELGFEHYEISNFAKSGQYSRHNTVYWKSGDYLGLGSGAASTVEGAHLEQTQSFVQYCKGPAFSGYEVEYTTVSERIEEYLMMGLRTRWGIDKGQFARRFGRSFDELFGHVLVSFEKNWYMDNPQSFSMTENGWMLHDEVLLRLVMEIPQSLDRT